MLLPGVLGLLVASALGAQGMQGNGVCEGDENYRALDFLLGEWRLVSGGEVVGESRVEKLEGGCLIAETRSFADGSGGRTYSSFDRAAGLWRRFAVSNGGVVVRSSGMVDGGALLLRGERVSADGEATSWRERWVPEADGRVRLSAGSSAAAGQGDRGGDALFDGYYEPVGRPVERPVVDSSVEVASVASAPAETAASEPIATAAGPATRESAAPEPVQAPVEPEPVLAASGPESQVPEPAAAPVEPGPVLAASGPESAAPTAGEVTPASARATDAERIERIAMASPMVLRLPLGPVEALPRDYAWITRDTAPYLCEGVTIERLEVSRRRRRGQIELEVELAVLGEQVSRAVDIAVDLQRAGQSSTEAAVASGTASSRVGRSIPEQVQYGSVAVVVRMSMDAEVFDAVVADPERPDLVITLTARK